jgi:hypothetical protein
MPTSASSRTRLRNIHTNRRTTTQRNRASEGYDSPTNVQIHTQQARTAVRDDESTKCLFRPLLATYDEDVSSRAPSSSSSRFVIPGGVVATRRFVRRTGGVMALGVAVMLWLGGMIVSWLVSGPIGGAASFVGLVLAVPALPLFGVPSSGGSTRILLAVLVSAVVWWFVGQVSAARVAQRPVVGRREWFGAFVSVAIGIWLGALGGIALGALALGAL